MLEHGRKIVTILAADVVEYSRLMGMDEMGTLAALNVRRALFDQLVVEHEGHEFGSVGDSLMAHFPSAVNAVHCAQAIQQAMNKENASLTPERHMALRIGVNLGDVVEKDGLLYGDGVNVAARLQAMAAPGGIIVSGTVYEQVKNKLSADLVSLGARSLKNIAEPVRCYEVTGPVGVRGRWPAASWRGRPGIGITTIALLLVLCGGAFWYYQVKGNAPVATPAPAAALPAVPFVPNDKSIAVLPFVDMSAEKNQEYMADGIAEELLNLLAQVPDLKVTARTSSFSFKGQNIDIAEIAKRLNVAHVLEGSVRKSGNTLRITALLVRASDSSHLWSQKYERQMTEVFKVQDEIAGAVAAHLKISLLGPAPKTKVTDPMAYSLFLQARQFSRLGSKESWEQSTLLYQQVLAIDPNYAAAWIGLAANYDIEITLGVPTARTVEDSTRLVRESVNKALAIDPEFAIAHASLGRIAIYYDHDLAAAARHVEHALVLDATNPEVIGVAADLAQRLGRLDQSIALQEVLVARDPLDPSSHARLGYTYRYAGRPDDVVSSFKTSLALSPGRHGAQYFIGVTLMLKGEREAALAVIQQEPSELWRLLGLVMIYHALGRKTESDAALAELIVKHKQSAGYNIAYALAFRGEDDRAFEWLDKAVAYDDPGMPGTAVEPLFANLHDDPRWLPFLRKHGMAPEQLAAIKFEVRIP